MGPRPELWMLLGALALDLLLGEPPTRWHPVGWMGRWAAFWEEGGRWRRWGKWGQRLYGAFIVVAVLLPFVLLGWALEEAPLPLPARIVVGAIWLKMMLSLRALAGAANRVREALCRHNPSEAREGLKSLVSRNLEGLDEPLMCSAAIESVAENFCDAFVAPLFYFALLGLPGATAYRVINTLDAMLGYRGPYEQLGKFAARLDDVLNFIPARLSGLLVIASAFLFRLGDGRNAWRALLCHRGRTQSPNSGWPMSAMAGALRVELRKPGHYRLGFPQEALSTEKIGAAVRLLWGASLLATILFSGWVAYA